MAAMHALHTDLTGKVALVTGAAHRIGAVIAQRLHAEGMNIVAHYHRSQYAAEALQEELEAVRPNSVHLLQANLLDTQNFQDLAREAELPWSRLDVLINNASTFYRTTLGQVTAEQWEDLLGTNLKAPFFLAQACIPALAKTHGCIINIVDIHAERPLKAFPVYSIAKAGLVMLTKALAREVGPHLRVNAIAPGAILWPERDMSEALKAELIERTALKRQGHPQDVAQAALYLVRDANYMTGQVLTVDGGRSLGH